MKISYSCGAAALFLAAKNEAFTVSLSRQHGKRFNQVALASSHKNLLNLNVFEKKQKFSTVLCADTGNNPEDLSEFLGDDKTPEKLLAFIFVHNDDITSLQELLENGFEPDARFYYGNTLLHLIVLNSKAMSLDDDRYKNLLIQLYKSGANLQEKNNAGFTALDFLELDNNNAVFAENLNQAQQAPLQVSFNQKKLDAQLATFSMQTQPTSIGKRWIVELIKVGANPEHITPNGKTVFENIQNGWSKANVEAFKQLVIAAKFKSVANGLEKSLNNQYVNDKWIDAVMFFYKVKNTRT